MKNWSVRMLTVALCISVLFNIFSLSAKKASADSQPVPPINENQFKVQYNYKVVFADSDHLEGQLQAVSETGWEFYSVAARGTNGWLLVFRQFEKIRESI